MRVVAVVPTDAWLPLDCFIMITVRAVGTTYMPVTATVICHVERMMEFKLIGFYLGEPIKLIGSYLGESIKLIGLYLGESIKLIGLYLGESKENVTNFSPAV